MHINEQPKKECIPDKSPDHKQSDYTAYMTQFVFGKENWIYPQKPSDKFATFSAEQFASCNTESGKKMLINSLRGTFLMNELLQIKDRHHKNLWMAPPCITMQTDFQFAFGMLSGDDKCAEYLPYYDSMEKYLRAHDVNIIDFRTKVIKDLRQVVTYVVITSYMYNSRNMFSCFKRSCLNWNNLRYNEVWRSILKMIHTQNWLNYVRAYTPEHQGYQRKHSLSQKLFIRTLYIGLKVIYWKRMIIKDINVLIGMILKTVIAIINLVRYQCEANVLQRILEEPVKSVDSAFGFV